MPTSSRPLLPAVLALVCLIVFMAPGVPALAGEKAPRPPILGHESPILGTAEALALKESESRVGAPGIGHTSDLVMALDGPQGEAVPPGYRFSEDIVIDTQQAMDPDMRQCVAEDGTIYALFKSEDLSQLQIQRSQDGGKTWSWFGQWVLFNGSAMADIAVAGGNAPRLIVVSSTGTPGIDSLLLALSIDLTDSSYLPDVVLTNDVNLDYDFPRICVDSPEYSLWYPYVVFHQSDAAGNKLMFTRSTDYGVTWQEPVELADNAWRYQAPSLDFGGAVLTVAYTLQAPLDVFIVQSGDFGTTFTPPLAIAATDLSESRPVVAAANDGSLTVVAFTRHYSATMTDIDCVWNDGGAIWNQAYLPYTEDNDHSSDLSFAPDGSLLHATYMSRGGVVYTQASTPETASWSEPRRINGTPPHGDAFPQVIAWDASCVCYPDLNCDGGIDEWDRLALVAAIEDPNGYQIMFPDCDIAAGDLDCNGAIDSADLVCFDNGWSCCPGGTYQDANVIWAGEGNPVPCLADQVRTYYPDPLSPAPAHLIGASLEPARPNPFNARTSIAFHLPAAGPAKLAIYTVDGRCVAILADGEMAAGQHQFDWDGRDSSGRNCASGIYLARLESPTGSPMQRLVMVK